MQLEIRECCTRFSLLFTNCATWAFRWVYWVVTILTWKNKKMCLNALIKVFYKSYILVNTIQWSPSRNKLRIPTEKRQLIYSGHYQGDKNSNALFEGAQNSYSPLFYASQQWRRQGDAPRGKGRTKTGSSANQAGMLG